MTQERFFMFWGVKVRERVLRLVLGASVAFLAACATEAPTTDSGWTCQYCHNVTLHQTGTGFWFGFPGSDGVHYVVKNLGGRADSVMTRTFQESEGLYPPAQTILGAVPVLADSVRPAVLVGGEARESTQFPSAGMSGQDSRGGTQTISVKGGDALRTQQLEILSAVAIRQSNAALTVRSSGAATITATFTITGVGKIVSEGGGTPQVRLYFQRRGDDMMATKGTTEFYRWWSVQTVILKDGTFTLKIPLTPKNWQSVYGTTGDKAVKQFNDAWNDALVAGMTFGDQYGAGHGVHAASGKPRFTLTGFTVQ